MSMVLARDQVRRVDQLALERYGLLGVMMMENAGRNAAELINHEFGPAACAFICCGAGNNGGDGCVIARHLNNAGWSVRVYLAGEASRMSQDMKVNFRVVEAMGLSWRPKSGTPSGKSVADTIRAEDVVIDALLGTGFRGEVRSPIAEIINAINGAEKRATVAVDIPSGLDCDLGTPAVLTVRADLTITFVASKPGFSVEPAAQYVGRVAVVDIGVPRELITGIHSGAL